MQTSYRKRLEHNPDNYLKAILESIEYYNAYERLDMARWLYKGYEEASGKPNNLSRLNAFVLELVSKLIQELEDLAILCLMFAGSKLKYYKKPIIKADKLPFEVYIFVRNEDILKFYTVAKAKLNKSVVSAIYGYKTPQQLLKERAISYKEVSFFKREIDKLYVAANANLNKLGSLYSSKKRPKGKQGYGKFVQVYFKTKHGYKVLQPTKTTKMLWQVEDTDILLVDSKFELKSGRKLMAGGRYNGCQKEDVGLLMKRIEGWSKVIVEIVGAQLRKLDNPNYLVPMIRKIKTEEIIKKGNLKVGRNDPCPCGSDTKYKRCCGRN